MAKILKRNILNKDVKRYIGPHTKLKFEKDNNWYWFKNFNPNYDGIFINLPGVGIKFKKLDNVVEVWNGQLFKIVDSLPITENTNIDDQLERGIEVEKEHLPTYNKIKEYYDEFKKLPSKEEFYSWIAEDHIEEFKEEEYYKALEQMEEELKNKIMTEEVYLTDLQEADETVPEVTELEKKEEIISNRQEIENVIGNIEAALLNEQNVLIPPKINYILRLNNILTALKSLRNDLDAYSKIVQENKDMKFSKEDVKLILETNYRIVEKKDQLFKIAVRNVFKENKSDLYNYNLEVFFDENCVYVNPTIITESSEALANKVLSEIYEDLESIKSNDEILNEEIIEEFAIDEYDVAANDYLNNVLNQFFLNQERDIEFLDKNIEKKDEDSFATNENIKTDIEIFLTTLPVSEYEFDESLIVISYEFYNKLNVSPGDNITPETSKIERTNGRAFVENIYVNGDKINLSEENKKFIENFNWLNYAESQL